MGNNARRTARLYFVHSGYVDPGYRLRYADNDGGYWSGRANLPSPAYSLYFNPSYVDPSGSYDCYFGISVRCVAGWE